MSHVDLLAVTADVDGAGQQRSLGAPGGRVGRYTILQPLGEGGMGVVLDAFDPELNRRVAIKLIRPERSCDRARVRLLREAQAMARLSHPNVVQIYDVGVVDDQVFVAMERISGCTLNDWLAKRPRTWRDVVARFVAAGRGLAATHDAGLVHRDFKPQNVLISDEGRVVVADYGLASSDASDDHPTPDNRDPLLPRVTAAGAVVGTPSYMAPEQHEGERLSAATDQFAFSVALHEALFGERPFRGRTLDELRFNVCSDDYVPPRALGRVPPWIVAVVRRGLSSRPGERYPDMLSMLAALLDDPDARRRRRHRLLGSIAVFSVVLAGAGWWGGGVLGAEPCDGGQSRFEETWTPQHRELARQLVRTDSQASWESAVVGGLDRYEERWSAQFDGACEAHRDGEISTTLFDASLRCLDRRLASVRGVVVLLDAGTGAGEPAELASAVGGLPLTSPCVDPGVLAQDVAPPEFEADAVKAEQIREGAARAEVLHDAGRTTEAVPALDAAKASADALGYPPLVAEINLLDGRLAIDRMDWTRAEAALAISSRAAVASGMDAVAAEALARGIFVDATLAEDPARALQHEGMASALLERAGRPVALEALLANNLGTVYARTGRIEEARRHFAHARGSARSATVHPVDRSGFISNLAVFTQDDEARDRLFAQASEEVTRAFGADHLKALELRQRRAAYTPDVEAALGGMAPICPKLRTALGATHHRVAACFARVAELYEATGDATLARVSAREAVSALPGDDTSDHPDAYLAAYRARLEGYGLVLSGEVEAGSEKLERARELMLPKADLPWVETELLHVDLLRARGLAALGRRDAAIALAERVHLDLEHAVASTLDQELHVRRALARSFLVRLERGA